MQNLSSDDYFDILMPFNACQMTIFLEAALGNDWDPKVKEKYLDQFMEYVINVAIY